MNTRLAILSAALFPILNTLSAPAQAELANCAAREVVIGRLADDYGEVFQGGGLQGANAMFEIWVADGGTWTLLLTDSMGLSCIIAAGTDWQPGMEQKVSAGDL
ncbi:hypothetical protein [Jannaschia pohangensis]|uniref:Uncharacterized protein n=1 Tax=Jannaschia pohangensis TaxID=390807 RepID=A0A1I3TXD6_9RHOB|nr:hypothetical protein [Jannaschia pohangensis]SFJ75958.1 hypothetical protein SAMN04488095_3594 [Jannaschia pohangensis]